MNKSLPDAAASRKFDFHRNNTLDLGKQKNGFMTYSADDLTITGN
ncbi:MAG TPA: hypothetical protein PKD88_01845 [Nitrosomonas sp.]|nr:hypothetical protein [Nitrosomonas sp.]HMV11455.1 hypothetical protein [Nitrosomonas sp.]HMW19732.1 hypothetical protein [Nitrosomonas sp.]HMW68386.1 hypothetical protein [Nitrosomonas sp.]HMY61002.1 hypothetical protein [Nitrosomonas sp.]